MITAYIALGSNLNTPVEQLHAALKAISQLPNTHLVTTSSFIKQTARPTRSTRLCECRCKSETELSPLKLLDELQRIENEQGRVRLRRWGERTLDLDILLYGNEIIQNERLIIPHYDMHNREFVIVPLFEIASDLVLPNSQIITELVKQFADHKMIKLNP